MLPYIICGCFTLVPFSIYPSRSASFSVSISYIIMDCLLSGKSHRLERTSSHISVIHPRDPLWQCHVGAETLSALLCPYVNVMLQNNLMSLCLQLDLHEFSNTLKKTAPLIRVKMQICVITRAERVCRLLGEWAANTQEELNKKCWLKVNFKCISQSQVNCDCQSLLEPDADNQMRTRGGRLHVKNALRAQHIQTWCSQHVRPFLDSGC